MCDRNLFVVISSPRNHNGAYILVTDDTGGIGLIPKWL